MKKIILAVVLSSLLAGCASEREGFVNRYPELAKSYTDYDLCHALGLHQANSDSELSAIDNAEINRRNISGGECTTAINQARIENQRQYTPQSTATYSPTPNYSTGSQVAMGISAGLNAAMQQQQAQQREQQQRLEQAMRDQQQAQRDADLHSIADSLNRMHY